MSHLHTKPKSLVLLFYFVSYEGKEGEGDYLLVPLHKGFGVADSQTGDLDLFVGDDRNGLRLLPEERQLKRERTP